MGYIDNLQDFVANSQQLTDETNAFREEVKEAAGLCGNVTDDTLMGRVEYIVTQGR